MTTEVSLVIERRDTGRDNWAFFFVSYENEKEVLQKTNWFRNKYPEHRFRVVKVTKTREVLQNPR